MPKWKNEETGEVIDYIPPATSNSGTGSPPPEMVDYRVGKVYGPTGFGETALRQVFSSFPGKTLKLKVKTGETLERSVLAAYRYVSNLQQEYNRIEFKYGDCYIVVARLKEEKD